MLRIDDIDPPRIVPGASAAIVATLERFGFRPDGPVRYQSERLDRYALALARLAADGLLFRCRCTRRALRDRPRYPGTCRARALERDATPALAARPLTRPADALRVRLDGAVRFEDAVQGSVEPAGGDAPGDVVVRRRDGLVAYPLACAVDDADVAQVVRGADLLETSAAQLALLERLGARVPGWAHVPVALDERGEKLGKSSDAPPIDACEPLPTLLGLWRFLGQASLEVGTLDAFWREAPARWSLAAVPRVRERPASFATAVR